VTERLSELPETGWRVPPARLAQGDDRQARPATASDVLDDREGGGGLSINLGDMIAPAGLYASDRDMFVFMVNEKNPIEDGRGNRSRLGRTGTSMDSSGASRRSPPTQGTSTW
jgi:hypothetical protein